MDIAAVERRYCIDWVMQGIFGQPAFANSLVLRGSAALQYAHCPDYTAAEEPEFISTQKRDATDFDQALHAAARASGIKLSLVDLAHSSAKVEYTGPLGRRSAAQPRITLLFASDQLRRPPTRVPLIHPFSDDCTVTVAAVALEEFTAERLARLGQAPRARDVFDLWFVLTHAREHVDLEQAHALAQQITLEKNGAAPLNTRLVPAHRDGLARSWDKALRRVPRHPPFGQVEKELLDGLAHINPAE
jgi:predicted nucleotidyltransferase component of viral defense system